MQIERLEIDNFRAIERVAIDAQSTMVVIAGPNGCGKSCVLDGIRFIKSAYGGYDPNEWDQWLGEFQIDRQREPWQMRKVLRDKSKSARISIALRLHPKEKLYLQENEREIAEEIAVHQINPGLSFRNWRQRIRISGEQRHAFLEHVDTLTQQLMELVRKELKSDQHHGAVTRLR